MSTKQEILILGYGEMGHAFEELLQAKHKLSIWSRSYIKPEQSTSLEALVAQADVIIFALPVNAHTSIIKKIAASLKVTTLCISIAKGLDALGLTAAEIFEKNLESFALIYGPMLSEEICNQKMGFAQFYCKKPENIQTILELFQESNLLLTQSKDIIGISWSVILKNVYALAFGMADELKLGQNFYGFLIVTALHELDTIIQSLGATKGSSYGLAGLGDLISTASSEDSRHHTLGREMAKGDFSELKAEGIHTLFMLKKFKRFSGQEYLLLTLIEKIVAQEIKPKEALESLCKKAL